MFRDCPADLARAVHVGPVCGGHGRPDSQRLSGTVVWINFGARRK